MDIAQHGGPFGGGNVPKTFSGGGFTKTMNKYGTVSTQSGITTAVNTDLIVGGHNKFYIFPTAAANGYKVDKAGNILGTAPHAHATNKQYGNFYPVRDPNGDDIIFANLWGASHVNKGDLYKYSEATNTWTRIWTNASARLIFFSVDRVGKNLYMLETDGSTVYNLYVMDYNGNILTQKVIAAGVVANQPPIFVARNGGLHMCISGNNSYREFNIATATFVNTTPKFSYGGGTIGRNFVDDSGYVHLVSNGGWYYTRPDGRICNCRWNTYYADNWENADINDYGDGIASVYNHQTDEKMVHIFSTWYGENVDGLSQSLQQAATTTTLGAVGAKSMGIINEDSYAMFTRGSDNVLCRNVYNRTTLTSSFFMKGRLVKRMGGMFTVKEGANAAVVKKSSQSVTINATTTILHGVHPTESIIL
jgi:hypothetical protein